MEDDQSPTTEDLLAKFSEIHETVKRIERDDEAFRQKVVGIFLGTAIVVIGTITVVALSKSKS